MGFASVKQFAEADAAGRTFTSYYRKAYTASLTAAMWLDNSTVAGGPPANFYAASPLAATTLDGSRGIYHGDDKSPSAMFLTHWGVVCSSVNPRGQQILLDYLLYYPFVDSDDLAQQDMDNTVTLPRYTDGEGVMVMPVCQSAFAGGGQYTFNYTNQDGVSKTSPVQQAGTPLTIGSIGNIVVGNASGGANTAWPFCTLAHGDRGVRSIESVTFSVANGGLLAFVLVRPLADNAIREASTMSEKEFVARAPGAPRVYDGAYLNTIMYYVTSPSSTQITGYLKFAWDEGV